MSDAHYKLNEGTSKPARDPWPELAFVALAAHPGDDDPRWRLIVDGVLVDLKPSELFSPSAINKKIIYANIAGRRAAATRWARLLPVARRREWMPRACELMREAGTIYARNAVVQV
jgi:hypothetical protein